MYAETLLKEKEGESL